jgi:asparagine synthetase B (glutamine-hydrolysing)
VVTDGRTVWAFRDHVGSQALFYRAGGGRRLLATEAKQVVAGDGLPRVPDLDVVTSIFYGAYDDDTPAALVGARRLPKATMLEMTPDSLCARPYWHPERLIETRRVRDRREIGEAFSHLMDQAVRRTLTGADVVSLSGGVDAPTVAAFGAPAALEKFGMPLPALSTVYPGIPSADESHWIHLVAERLGMPLETFVPSSTHLGDLATLGRLLDGPVPTVWFSEIDEFYRRAAAAGFQRILSGECAEYVIEMRAGLLPYLLSRGRWRSAARFLSSRRRGGAQWGTLTRSVVRASIPDPWVQRLRRGRPPAALLRVPDFVDASRVNTADPAAASTKRQHWREEQLHAFRGPGLSFEADAVVQDRHRLLVRRPWMDIDLWEYWLSLRAEDKFPASRYKALVKDLMRGRLPDEVLDRRSFTTFNDVIMSRVDYAGLEAWLLRPQWQMPGVDYRRLQQRLEERDLSLPDYVWAKDLATAHAFVQG